MTTIYAVASGSYSDYSVGPHFTTRELAQRYIDTHTPYDHEFIEEFELYDDTTVIASRRYIEYLYGEYFGESFDEGEVEMENSLTGVLPTKSETYYEEGVEKEKGLLHMKRTITDNHPDDWWMKRVQKAAYDLMKHITMLREQDHLPTKYINVLLAGNPIMGEISDD